MNSPSIGLDGLWRSQPSFRVSIFSTKRSKASSGVKGVLFSVKANGKRSLMFSLFLFFDGVSGRAATFTSKTYYIGCRHRIASNK